MSREIKKKKKEVTNVHDLRDWKLDGPWWQEWGRKQFKTKTMNDECVQDFPFAAQTVCASRVEMVF